MDVEEDSLLSTKNILELQERILVRIARILTEQYGELADDLTIDNVSAKLAFKGDPHINELRLALERINRGEYGHCIFCKGEIAMDILRELPTAHFCQTCSGALLKKRETRKKAVLNT